MKNIKILRKQANLSQADFAKLFHVHQTAVSQWEQGRTMPDKYTALQIAKQFGVSMDYVMDVENDQRKPASQDVPERNIVRIAGRNGTFEERHLTDEQLAALEAILRQMPNIEDDNL